MEILGRGKRPCSGDSFIQTGGEDIYFANPLFDANQDFIAHARQDIPKLIAEVRRLRELKTNTNPNKT